MADVNFEVTRFSVSTAASGTQDVTISGTTTPSAAIFILSGATADDTITAGQKFGIGFTDGTRSVSINSVSSDGAETSNTASYHTNAACISRATAGLATAGLFSFNSWLNSGGNVGVRLDIDEQMGSAWLVTVIFVIGTDVTNAYCNEEDDLGTTTAAVNITNPNFEPDLVFMVTAGSPTAGSGAHTHSQLSFGIGHNDGSDTQRVMIFNSRDNRSTTVTNSYIGNDSIVGAVFADSLTWDAVIGSYDSQGFSVTPNAGVGSDIIHYLALKFSNSPDIKLGDMFIDTVDDYAETGPNFEPNFGMVCLVEGPTTRNAAPANNNETMAGAIAAFDASNIYTASFCDEDGVGTTVAKSMSSDRLSMVGHDGSEAFGSTGTPSFFDSQGWDISIGTNPSQDILGFYLAIGAGTAATNPKGPLGHPFHGPFGGPL